MPKQAEFHGDRFQVARREPVAATFYGEQMAIRIEPPQLPAFANELLGSAARC